MSLAERVAAQAKNRELKTLIIDIERLPGRAIHQHRGLTLEGDFWDLNSWKHTLGYRIPPDAVVEWPTTICFAAMWYGQKRPVFHAAWDKGGADAMYEAAWALYDEAHLAITYNGVGFDNKHLTSGWTERGMGRPSHWKDIDLLKTARSSQGWESKTLDSVCKRLGIPAKNDRYQVAVARAAMAGDVAKQRQMRRYNCNDVTILPAVYERLLPNIKGHPHVAPMRGLGKVTCPRCSSQDVKPTDPYSPGVFRYYAFWCKTCKGPFATTYESRGPSVRAL